MMNPVQMTNGKSTCAFWVGRDNLLANANGKDVDPTVAALDEVRIRIGTLLKTETVSFLLGAGASVHCGGPLIGSVPPAIERALHRKGIVSTTQPRVSRWLKHFYLAVGHAGEGAEVLSNCEAILERKGDVESGSAMPLPANFEHVLSQLHRWRAALPRNGGRLRIEGDPPVALTAEDIEETLLHTTEALAAACRLPAADKKGGLAAYAAFLRKLLTRPLNLKRVNVFTLNYDTLVEQAGDAEGIVLLDGFVGTQRRTFRPESYEQDLYFPAQTTEGQVHRFDRVVHLYKLHGSITWVADEPSIENPYGVSAASTAKATTRQRLLIYPTPAKYGKTLGMPYSELFRRFATALVRPQSVLFAVGYGFGDEHVNAIVRQALAVPSFTLVIIDPRPESDFVKRLREQNDQRVWVAQGDLGEFAGFVDRLLPDLREEDIRQRVLATQRALTRDARLDQGKWDGDR